MYIERQKLSTEDKERISFVASIFLIVIFVFLAFIFWNAQVLKNQHYKTLALQNMVREIELKAPRGFIKDRNGIIISENKLAFSLKLIREGVEDIDKTVKFACDATGMTPDDINKAIDRYKRYPRSYAIPLKKNLSLASVIYIKSRSDLHPEFEIEVDPTRAYPLQEEASHILGYISEITVEELKANKSKGYKPGDVIGRSGIEKQYEDNLRGKKGSQIVMKDNLGTVQQVLQEVKPALGSSVVLTIDMVLQTYIEQLMADHLGTVAVVDLSSGGLLAMVSTPNYNPDLFTGAMTADIWRALINDPRKPMQNKFTQGLYSPGSTFKIVMALGGLQEGVIGPMSAVNCYGAAKIYDRYFHCWVSSGHGTVNLYSAMRDSCNIYFYQLGKKLDIDIIARYGEMLGLGGVSGIDIPSEKMGRVPSRAWKQKYLKQKWYPGETISVAIGGGMLSVTPAQVLTMISTVALRGKKPRLHLLKEVDSGDGITTAFTPRFTRIPIKREHFEAVIEGLFRVVNDGGTGRAARIPGFDICGKTGTQQIISKENPKYKELVKQKRFKPHSWFVSFAPRDNPRYAMVVFVENGGDAGGIAAPLAGKIYRKLFE